MRKNLLLNLCLLLAGGGAATAATITWDAVIVNTTAADILTAGTLHIAIDAASSNPNTINGVTFMPGNPLGSNAQGTFWTAGSGVHTTGDAGLDDLLNSHSYSPGNPAVGSFDILGLTPGQAYDIQIIAVGDTRACCSARTQQFGGGGSFSGDLTRFDPASVVGHFVADGPTQTINIQGGSVNPIDVGLSGYQVRAVPEPGSLSLLLLGVCGVALRRRR